jgi:hypothetical protein
MSYHLAQINVARMLGTNIDDPVMQEFVDNIDRINALAEASPGFIWRLQDESNDATSFNPYGDEQLIINISVWEDVDTLRAFVFRTGHADFVRRRKAWFRKFGKAYMAMWWLPASQVPTVDEAVARLAHLQTHGPSAYAFDFKALFLPPSH